MAGKIKLLLQSFGPFSPILGVVVMMGVCLWCLGQLSNSQSPLISIDDFCKQEGFDGGTRDSIYTTGYCYNLGENNTMEKFAANSIKNEWYVETKK